MASAPRRSGGDVAAVAVPFSYAQAAKGISSNTSTGVASKSASGTITPSKDSASVPSTLSGPSGMNWADDAEASDPSAEKAPEKEHSVRDAQPNGSSPTLKPTVSQPQTTPSGVSSPELGTSSTSTVIKDDDVSSLQNNSSESTWDNKSQTSNPVEKPTDSADQAKEKPKSKETETVAPKPLQEAPIPTVNIWTQRATQFAKWKVPANTSVKASGQVVNGVPQTGSAKTELNKKAKGSAAGDEAELTGTKDRNQNSEAKSRVPFDERSTQARKDAKLDAEGERNRKGTKSRPLEKENKITANVLPLPPDRDQESWPTPESAIDEDKKKAQEKGEKSEKERSQAVTSRAHGKNEWVPVPYTPNVIFSTPLPNTAPARRGGRSGGRGASQASNRGSQYAANDSSAQASLSSGRGGADNSAPRDSSPSKARKVVSNGSPTSNEVNTIASPTTGKSTSTVETETPAKKALPNGELSSTQQGSGQNTYPRQFSSGRSKQGRKGDGPAEKRREGDLVSPSKENTLPHDRRTSVATQPEDEVRSQTFTEGQNVQQKQTPSDRRAGPFGSFPGRDREHRSRGSMRGGRGANHGFQNSHHQYSNGHVAPLQSTPNFQMPRSPTTFHPDAQSAYFSPPTHGRSFRNNNSRSQSVTTENIYGRPPNGYPNGPQPVAPIHTYMGQVPYDYQMMQPMSAVPYSPYVDSYTLFSMVATQLEYYFSVENLCKDMYLRKHMDSQGFVFLSKIADFNRIKQLTTDTELIKLVCYQSHVIEFRVGVDGKDRLRRKDGWEQWVLTKTERDASAQNDGPEELHHPPVPHPQAFEPQYSARYPEIPGRSPASPVPNGVPNGAPLNPTANGVTPNGYPAHNVNTQYSTLNGEADSFSDEQVESLSVIVRKQDQEQNLHVPPSATRTFSNGSIDSKTGVTDDVSKSDLQQPSLQVNGTGPSQGEDGKIQDRLRRSPSPFSPTQNSTMTPVRLFWVKGKDNPVESLPSDATYEFYTHLRTKALEQRQIAPIGNCPYDMDVLYQFWSHFLIRNFNTRMYDEFRHFAFEDVSLHMSDIGLKNLVKYYGESLSSQNTVRARVARHFIDIVKSENAKEKGPAFKQLKAAWINGSVTDENRKIVSELVDPDLRSALED